MSARLRALVSLLLVASLAACGAQEEPASTPPPAPAPSAPEPPAAAPAPEPAAALPQPDDMPKGLVLALAQFVKKEGKPVPGPARLEFLYREGGEWKTAAIEDAESNVFHKAMVYETGAGPPGARRPS